MSGLIFCDGFDKYGPAGTGLSDAAFRGDWSVVSGNIAIGAGLSSGGYSYIVTSVVEVTATLPAVSRIAGSVRIRRDTSTTGLRFIHLSSGNAVFTTAVEGGAIVLRTGGTTGAIIASGGSLTTGAIYVLSWDVTVGASSPYAFYLNGTPLFSGTGNTGNGRTTVNQFQITNTTSSNFAIDDLALFDPAQPTYNSAVLTSNVVVETQYPTGDAQKQLTNDGNAVWATGVSANGVFHRGSTISIPANTLTVMKVTPVVNCTLDSISIYGSAVNSTIKFRGVVYSDSAGSPGTLLSSGVEIIGITDYVAAVLPLVTPQSLTAGVPVWIGIINDITYSSYLLYDSTMFGQRKTNTYTAGAPASGAGMTVNMGSYGFWGNCTNATSNAASVMLNPAYTYNTLNQIRSATAGQEDLYLFPAVVGNPTIFGMAVKGYVSKNDSGLRNVSFNTKSGGLDVTGSDPNQLVTTNGQWQRSIFSTDPLTGAAWLPAALNSATSGVSVAT